VPAPIKSIRVGAIQLSIWENPMKGKDEFIRSCTISKSYKMGEEWKTTTSFKMADLPLIQVAMQKALEFHYLKEDDGEVVEGAPKKKAW